MVFSFGGGGKRSTHRQPPPGPSGHGQNASGRSVCRSGQHGQRCEWRQILSRLFSLAASLSLLCLLHPPPGGLSNQISSLAQSGDGSRFLIGWVENQYGAQHVDRRGGVCVPLMDEPPLNFYKDCKYVTLSVALHGFKH